MKRLHHHRDPGFSLIVCLIILTLLSILVVSFITTTTSERTTSKAYLNKATAELAANTAVNQAISLLTEQIAQYPDSATVWDSVVPPTGTKPADNLPVEGTYLYYTTTGPNFSTGTSAATPRPARVLPLFSRSKGGEAITDDVEITAKNTVLGTEAWNDTTSVNLNRARDDKDSDGWIGSPPTATPAPGPGSGAAMTPTPKPFRAKWIEIKDQAPLTSGTPIPGTPTPKVIGRYAYWVEDESFKVNLNLLSNGKRGREMDVKDPITGAVTAKGELTLDAEALARPFYQTHPERASDCPAWHTPIQGLLRSASAPFMSDEVKLNAVSSAAFTLRDEFFGKQLFELRAFNRAGASATPDPAAYLLGDKTKFFATIFSSGLNVSRQGSQRLNLSGLGFDRPYKLSSVTTADEEKEYNRQIQRLVEAIRYHAPKFGQRFYRNTAAIDATTLNAEQVMPLKPTDPPHQTIYLYKLAANIRDYIDPDSQPTMIQNNGLLAPRAAPALAMSAHEGDNDYWAQGKDAAPFLQEAVARFRSQCFSDRTYKLKVDYYIEFWNMTGQDIYAKETPGQRHLNNAFVKIADPVGWFGHGGGTAPLTDPSGNPSFGRELTIDLSTGVYKPGSGTGNKGTPAPDGVVFRAGTCTVITSDPDDLLPASAGSWPGSCYTTGGLNKTVTYYCSNLVGKREFAGPLPPNVVGNPVDGIWPQFRDAPNSSGQNQEDYGTEVILANSYGYLDSHPYTISKGGGPNVTYLNQTTSNRNYRDDTYGGTLFGNGNSPSQLGDPRTNNEQMVFRRWKLGGIGEPDQTRYFNPTVSDDYRFSLGWPNSRYVFPARTVQRNTSGTKKVSYAWKDRFKVWDQTMTDEAVAVPNPDAKTAPAFVANENIRSIGQLGDIFDPARLPGNGSYPVTSSRGGGRTLRVGQPDLDTIKMDNLSDQSQQWASWRLADFLSPSNELYLPGQININGLRRDNGAALRAACYGLTMKATYCSASNSDTTAADPSSPTTKDAADFNTDDLGLSPATPGLQKLINEAKTRLELTDLTRPTYFRERGEISELKVFSSKATDLLLGIRMYDAFDRSREELVRRLIDMITTRGNVFSVYAVGQSINQGKDGVKRVTGEHWVKTTFTLVPRKADGSAFRVEVENFDPANAAAISERFAKPDHYDVQILQVASP